LLFKLCQKYLPEHLSRLTLAMPLTVYGPQQTRAMRATWMLRELGLEFEQKTEMPPVSVNPNKKYPALVDGDFILFESFAITQYLVAKYGANTPLCPKDVTESALTQQWSLWAITECEAAILSLMTKGAMGEPKDQKAAAEKLVRPLTALEESLKGKEYLMGNRFTVADLNVAAIVGIWGGKGAKLDLSPYPNLSAWVDRCTSRPACKPPKAKAKL
jgi:glutathione S-transferase